MIYSASRRTDLVAFYPDFIAEKVRRSRKLEAIVVWTKDPRNIVNHTGLRAALRRYPAVIQLTITGLAGTKWEPNVCDFHEFAPFLKKIAQFLPKDAIRWRFDPIIATPDLYERFSQVFQMLKAAVDYSESITISFPDPYEKVVKHLQRDGMELPKLSRNEEKDIVTRLNEISGLNLAACCEPHLLNLKFVEQSRCVDGKLFDRLYGTSLGNLSKDKGQRTQCGCSTSTDIGSYELACRHNCRYCYANPEE